MKPDNSVTGWIVQWHSDITIIAGSINDVAWLHL